MCIKAYEGSKRETPCVACRPELRAENVPFFILHAYCHDQYIMGSNGPVSLNGSFIHEAMDEYHIDPDERILFSMQVRKIAQVIFSAQAEEQAERLKKK